jgi:preprotein translocase subunit SecB|tara:strand:- start:576 stop:998 length:423 start_codon:yes stop_codon:yes gene_type:complete
MTEKFNIIGKYIKDISSETKDIETYIFVRDRLTKYKMAIDIKSMPLKNKLVEVNTVLKFEDKEEVSKKSYFEMTFATIVKISEEVKAKEEFEKILLCDVQIKIYPDIEKSFLNLLHNSGYTGFQLENKIDFQELYNNRYN